MNVRELIDALSAHPDTHEVSVWMMADEIWEGYHAIVTSVSAGKESVVLGLDDF
jgi:hypothetical protein